MIESVSSFIEGLRYGSDEQNLVRLDDHAFQNKMKELDEHFQELQKRSGKCVKRDMKIRKS